MVNIKCLGNQRNNLVKRKKDFIKDLMINDTFN